MDTEGVRKAEGQEGDTIPDGTEGQTEERIDVPPESPQVEQVELPSQDALDGPPQTDGQTAVQGDANAAQAAASVQNGGRKRKQRAKPYTSEKAGLTGGPACGAKCRSTGGQPCRNPAMPNGRCRMHGGKSLAGPLAGPYKHGRYSKCLPTGLLGRYQELANDPEILSAHDEVVLLTGRIVELASRLRTGEGPTAWEQVQSAHAQLIAGIRSGNQTAIQAALNEMDTAVKRGSSENEIWEGIERAIENKTRIASREWKRQADMKQLLTIAETMSLVSALVTSVKTHVADPAAVKAISRDVALLIRGPQQAVADDPDE